MKTPQFFLPLVSLDTNQATILIELVQKDAYNQALIDVAEAVKLKRITQFSGNMGEYDESYYVVDQDSISQLKK